MGAETELEPSIETSKALKLRLQGLTYAEIGKLAGGLSPQAIEQRLSRFKRLLEDPQGNQAYADHEAELLDATRAKVITTLVEKLHDENIKVSPYQLVGMHGWLLNSARLIRGESTANVHSLTEIIQAATARSLPEKQAEPVIETIAKPENE